MLVLKADAIIAISLTGLSFILGIFCVWILAWSKNECSNWCIRKKFGVAAVCYALGYAFLLSMSWIVCLCYLNLRVFTYLKLYMKGNVVSVDMGQYQRDFCMDAEQSAQVKCNSIGAWNYTKKSGPVNLPKKYSRRDKRFHFYGLHRDTHNRFIELLSSISLSYFSVTSKYSYYHCIDIRGLEYDYIHDNVVPERYKKNRVCLSTNGRRMGSNRRFSADLHKFVVCMGTLHFSFDCFQYQKLYRHLVIHLADQIFPGPCKRIARELIVAGVKSVKLYVKRSFAVNPSPPSLADVIDFLRLCGGVEKIGLCFHELRYKPALRSHSMSFGRRVLLKDAPPFAQIKAEIENWALSMCKLKFFKLIYNFNGFMLHKNKLKHMQEMTFRKWFLIEDYDVNDPKTVNGRHLDFLNQLEGPYGFEPYLFHQYFM